MCASEKSQVLAVARVQLLRRDAFDLTEVIHANAACFLDDQVAALEVGPKHCCRQRAVGQRGTEATVVEVQGRGLVDGSVRTTVTVMVAVNIVDGEEALDHAAIQVAAAIGADAARQ